MEPSTGPEYRVRGFEQGDLPKLESMYRSFEPLGGAKGLPPLREEKTARWLRILGDRGHTLVALDSTGSLIGHAVLADSAEGEAELAVFIHQACRAKGLGTRLARGMVQYAQRNGYRRVWATVSPANTAAIRMVESCGFRTVPGGWSAELDLELWLQEKKNSE